MKLDKFGRFVDIWDWDLNLLHPVKDVVKPPPVTLVDRTEGGRFKMTLTRNGVEGTHTGFGYNLTYARALKDLERNEGD
ncbi:MAG: hypothetical protein JKX91_06625 [Rhizobiaceae bacterium]|nr:hypothetical protein [Rhizobiaceae bacterium]